MGSGQSTERASSGAEISQRVHDEDVFTEDSDPDSEDTVEKDSDEELEENDPNEHEYQRLSEMQNVTGSYRMTELRMLGITQIHSKGPKSDRTDDFWAEIIKKRIPTVFQCCEFIESGRRVCAQYVPKPNEPSRRVGSYTVERVGQIVTLTATLQRQQFLAYRTDEPSYKHKVMHFQLSNWRGVQIDQKATDYQFVAAMASRQPNPQVLLHDTWSRETD